jgi:hypothetical protein
LRASDKIVRYLEAMTELEPQLPSDDRASLQAWYASPEFTRDSDWPGWVKYLGPRPNPRQLAIVKPFEARRMA